MKKIDFHILVHALATKLEMVLCYAAILLVCYTLLLTLVRILALWRMLKKEYVYLELTPPLNSRKTPQDSDQLYRVLHTIGIPKKLLTRLQQGNSPYSLEVVTDSVNGLRFVARMTKYHANHLRHQVTAHNKLVQIREIADPLQLSDDYRVHEIADFKLRSHFAFPSTYATDVTDHDAFAHLLGAMTELQDGEQIVMQLVSVPSKMRALKRRAKRFIHNYEHSLKNDRVQQHIAVSMVTTVGHILYVIIDDIFDQLYGTRNSNSQLTTEKPSQRNLSQPELELTQAMHAKANKHSFYTSVRVLVTCKEDQQRESRLDEIRAGFEAYAKSEHQGFTTRMSLPGTLHNRYRLFLFRNRLPAMFKRNRCILSTAEIASLYHFPFDDTALTDGLVKSLSRKLSTPLSQKKPENFDVVVGQNVYQEKYTDIGLSAETRLKHMYLIGSTGTGKTTLLEYLIYQDMMNNKGLAVLDPHGDMFQKLLAIVPEHRKKDVVVFNPYDREFPLGLNILAPGIHFANEEDSHSAIKSAVISVFSKLTDKAFWGPRMEHILECATLTALQLPNPSLYTLQKLLTDKRYMRESLKVITDPILKEFWLTEMLPLSDAQLATTVAPLTHRVGKFIVDPMSRNILLQQETTLRLSEIMDEGKILLVNLAKGDVGEDKSQFFGTVLTSLIWMAAFQRTHIDEEKRRDFYLYIDEFQNFAAPGFADITSEGRKFHIPLIASHQNIAQIEDQNLLKVIAGNSHTFICLRASPNDEAFILPFMEPAVEKGNIVNLSPHHFFMKTVAGESELAFSGVTMPLDVKVSEKTAKSVAASSRKRYGTPRKDIEAYLDRLFSDKGSSKGPPKDTPNPGKIGEQ